MTDVNIQHLVGFFGLGLAVTWLLVPIIIRRSQAWTVQREHSFHQMHAVPIPRLGGLALAVSFVLIVLGAHLFLGILRDRPGEKLGITVTALAMFGLGFVDDLRPLGARKKLFGQVLIATIACIWISRIEVFQNPLTGQQLDFGLWGIPITVLWLVAFTNLINLVDGIDGLAAGISLMLMALLAYVGMSGEEILPVCVATGLAGSLLAFLRYNFPPAKIYLGDGGAYFLGFLIGLLAMRQSQKGTVVAALIAPLLALALPILDVALAVLRRGLKGLPIFRADRKHLHHRLLAEGFSGRDTVLMLYGFSCFCLLAAFVVFWSKGRGAPVAVGAICLLLLLAASRFRFARDWFSLLRVVGESLEVRKETQAALALCQWFDLSAERAASAEALWRDFEFVVARLGFREVRLHLNGTVKVWAANASSADAPVHRHSVSLNHPALTTLEFIANADGMSEMAFDQLSELAAEACLKAVLRWQAASGREFKFHS